MTQDRNSTSADHLKASVTEAIGKLTGESRVEAEGRRKKRGVRTADADGAAPGRSKPTGSDQR
jgi:uncharacterized protein YjbJ (UPF0337 family)